MAYLVFEAEYLYLFAEKIHQQLKPAFGVEALQKLLGVLYPEIRVGRDYVRKMAGVAEPGYNGLRLIVRHGHGRVFRKEIAGRPHKGEDMRRAHDRGSFIKFLAFAQEVRHLLYHVAYSGPVKALHKNPDIVSGQLEHLLYSGDRSDAVKILRRGKVRVRGLLRGKHDRLIHHHGALQGKHGFFPSDVEIRHGLGKNYEAPERYHGHGFLFTCYGFVRHFNFLPSKERLRACLPVYQAEISLG